MTRAARARRAPAARKYLAVAGLVLRERSGERASLLARGALLALFVLVFQRLWQAVLPAHTTPGHGPTEYVWYIAITEWITLAQPLAFVSIERDVRSGAIAYRLSRPLSYSGEKLAEGLGELALNLSVLGLAAAATAYALAGGLPLDPRGLSLALPLGILACVLLLLVQILIGLSAFWLLDCAPLYWIWQKVSFVLGGLLVPLELYPDWLRAIALASPCAPLLYGPGSMAFGFDPGAALSIAGQLLGWSVCAALLIAGLQRLGLQRLEIHGG